MRPFGNRRGNPLLRASVEQSSRRRLEWIRPAHERGARGAHAGPPDPWRTREFYERIRSHVLPGMTPALEVDGADVRYFGGDGLGLWGLRATHGLVLAYECADTPAQLVERARRWLACLRTRTTPGMLDRTWGRPVYGARHDAASDRVEVVWARPGDWCGVVLADEPLPRRRDRPLHWHDAGLAPA